MQDCTVCQSLGTAGPCVEVWDEVKSSALELRQRHNQPPDAQAPAVQRCLCVFTMFTAFFL